LQGRGREGVSFQNGEFIMETGFRNKGFPLKMVFRDSNISDNEQEEFSHVLPERD
jgi:hypothetical protein